MLWRRKPRHHKAHDGGFPCHSRRRLLTNGADGSECRDSDGKQRVCNEIRNREIPCHIPQIQLLSSSHQRDDCAPQEANLLFYLLPAPTLPEM